MYCNSHHNVMLLSDYTDIRYTETADTVDGCKSESWQSAG